MNHDNDIMLKKLLQSKIKIIADRNEMFSNVLEELQDMQIDLHHKISTLKSKVNLQTKKREEGNEE